MIQLIQVKTQDGYPALLNPSHIVRVNPDSGSEGSIIIMSDGARILVTDDISQIKSQVFKAQTL